MGHRNLASQFQGAQPSRKIHAQPQRLIFPYPGAHCCLCGSERLLDSKNTTNLVSGRHAIELGNRAQICSPFAPMVDEVSQVRSLAEHRKSPTDPFAGHSQNQWDSNSPSAPSNRLLPNRKEDCPLNIKLEPQLVNTSTCALIVTQIDRVGLCERIILNT